MRKFETEEEVPFFKRNRIAICVLTVVILGAGAFAAALLKSKGSAPRREASITMVGLLPPPPPTPPPTPPPVQEPPPEEQKVQDDKPMITEDQPVNEPPPPDQPPEPESGPIGTGVQGNGPGDGFGLGGGRGIGGNGNGNGTGSGRSKYGWYAGQVQSRVAGALRTNRRTRVAMLSAKVRIWADTSGRITRATVSESSDPVQADALVSALNGLQLQEPPPNGMPMPIVMQVNSHRPN